MPPGNNKGGQLNVFLFEVGMITRDPLGILPDVILPIAIHPLVVNPATIRYSDTSRSSVVETPGGAVHTVAGRALRTVQFQGTFGVESRFLGLQGGTGDLRFQRFYQEVVRLSDAINKDQVDACKDLFRSPFLSLALAPYIPEFSTFFINYYDFWHNVQFNAMIQQFGWSKGRGSATGRTEYQLALREVGPIVTGGIGTALINGLFQALTTWDSINEIVKSYTLDAVTGGLVDAAGILVGQFTDSMNAVAAQIDGATGVVNGFSDPTAAVKSRTAAASGGSEDGSASAPEFPEYQGLTDDPANGQTGLSGYLGATRGVVDSGTQILEALKAQGPPAELDRVGGQIEWGGLEGEGSLAGVEAAQAQDDLAALIDAADFQRSVGGLYGMDREEFAAFLAATGQSGRDPRVSGTITYTVTELDTADRIAEMFGVSWEDILRLNRLLPDEALLAGTVLLIPRGRLIGQQNAIAGLPVFGSHAGRAAWGRDLPWDFRVDASGSLETIEGEEALIQGVDWLIELFGPELVKLANETPSVVRDRMLQRRIASIVSTDRRIASVDQVLTTQSNGAIEVVVSATAINGGNIRTGNAA